VYVENVNAWKFIQGSPFIKGIMKPLKHSAKYACRQMALNIAVFSPHSTFVRFK